MSCIGKGPLLPNLGITTINLTYFYNQNAQKVIEFPNLFLETMHITTPTMHITKNMEK